MASSTGHIALFDLSAKLRLLHLVRAAHEGPVGGMEWAPGQPLLITSGGDNSIKVRSRRLYRALNSRANELVSITAFVPSSHSNGSSIPPKLRLDFSNNGRVTMRLLTLYATTETTGRLF